MVNRVSRKGNEQPVITFEEIFFMKFPAPVTIEWLAKLVDANVVGDTHALATGINEIHKVERGDLVFVDHPKYYDKCLDSEASFIIINTEDVDRRGKTILVCKEPFEAYQKIVNHFRPFEVT
ncbi:MAG TPA: LpxD N-terminal domain-containing protein, partial [Chitinophagaceae bacterium]